MKHAVAFLAASLWANILMTAAAKAALVGDKFACSLTPGFAKSSLVLQLQLTETELYVRQPTNPPSTIVLQLIVKNAVGIIAISGTAAVFPGYGATVGGQVFFISRVTADVQWLEAGAEGPVTDRIGTCVSD